MSSELSYVMPDGKWTSLPVQYGADHRLDPEQSLLRARRIRLGGLPRLQIRLSVVDAPRPEGRHQLETEIGTALTLRRALIEPDHRLLFPEIVGYQVDCAEPFVLYAPPRGEPPAATGRMLVAEEQFSLVREILLALVLLERQGLVHRGVTPETVLWDGTRLQLWGLHAVQPAGCPRVAWGRPPYASPEQRLGQGLSDPRDALWSCAQVLYRLASGRHGPADRPPADLADHRSLASLLGDAFAPTASRRAHPRDLLETLAPDSEYRLVAPTAEDELAPHRAAYDRALQGKRQADPERRRRVPPRTEPEPSGNAVDDSVLCPYCLKPLAFDPQALHTADSRQQFTPLTLTPGADPMTRADELRGAYQLCPGNPTVGPHHVPVPYLMHGRPLTVVFVGQSATGKSHLLTQMIGEVLDGGLQPYGLSWESVNPQVHQRFVREWVTPLRNGQVLQHTAALGDRGQVRLVEALLVRDRNGHKRPLAFFDLAGEDLLRTDAMLRFLLGVDALVFVVDPIVALPHPVLEPLRGQVDGLERKRDGDPAFDTVLDRIPRSGPFLDVPAAIVLSKADLLRFEPPVDRYLGGGRRAPFSARAVSEESRDVYALLHRHAGRSWLRPFDVIRQCTLHVASATGGQAVRLSYPRGVHAERVLEPLLAVLAMHGLIEATATGVPAREGAPADSDGHENSLRDSDGYDLGR